jgi:hypothetical protein
MRTIKNTTGSREGDKYINYLLIYLEKNTTSIDSFIQKVKVVEKKNPLGGYYFNDAKLSNNLIKELKEIICEVKNIDTSCVDL